MSTGLERAWERHNERQIAEAERSHAEKQHGEEMRGRVRSAAHFAKEILERIGYSVPTEGRYAVEHAMQSGYIRLGELPEVAGRVETTSFAQVVVVFREDSKEVQKTRQGWFFTHTYTDTEYVPNFDSPSGIEIHYFASPEDKSTMTYFASDMWNITSYMDEAGITGVEAALARINEITKSEGTQT